MAQNLLNYAGLEYFLEQLKLYIESLRTVKNVDTTASNGINLSNTNGTLDVTVTPGSIADGDTGLVTGDAVYDAIQAEKAIEVLLTATANPNLYTASMPPAAIASFINSGKDVYILMPEGTTTLVYKAYSGVYYSGNSDIRYYNIYRDYNLNIVVREIKLVGTNATLTTYTLANLDSPLFTGTPTAPTPTTGDDSTKIATTEFVNSAIENDYFIVTGTYNNNTYTADKTALEVYEAAQAGKKILLVVNGSTGLGGISYYSLYRVESLGNNIYFAIYINISNTSVRPNASDTTTLGNAVITFFAHSGTTLNTQTITLASLNSPTFTGEPKAPTPTAGDNSTKIATTAFVKSAVDASALNVFSNVKVGSSTIAADSTTDTLELVAGDNITLTPDATNDKVTIVATDTTYDNATTSTAGLMSAEDKTKLDGIASGAEVNVVKSVDTTAGTSGINLSLSNLGKLDVTISSGSIVSGNSNFVTGGTVYSTTNLLAPKASPALTGTPTAPTAALGTNTTQLATTEFVNQTVANAQTGKAAFQGSVSSQSTITSLTDYKKGYHWIVQTAGTYVGQTCEVGDMIYCIADKNGSYDANDFTVIQNNLDITIITNAEIDALFTNE